MKASTFVLMCDFMLLIRRDIADSPCLGVVFLLPKFSSKTNDSLTLLTVGFSCFNYYLIHFLYGN